MSLPVGWIPENTLDHNSDFIKYRQYIYHIPHNGFVKTIYGNIIMLCIIQYFHLFQNGPSEYPKVAYLSDIFFYEYKK